MSSDKSIAKATAIRSEEPDEQSDVVVAEESNVDDSPWEVSSESDEELALHTNSQQPSTQTTTAPTTSISEADQSQHLITASIESVQFIISCLWKLPIRRPAPLDRIREGLVSETSPYDPFDLMHVKNKFPTTDERLASRLAKMISRRRQIMRYRKLHTDALQGHHSHTRRRIAAVIQDENDDNSEVAPSLAASTRYTHDTKATTLKLDTFAHKPPGLNTLYAPSVSSFTSSTGSNQDGGDIYIAIPERPKEESRDASKQFICPYCGVAQTITTDRKWK
jgi:hypothetical protein